MRDEAQLPMPAMAIRMRDIVEGTQGRLNEQRPVTTAGRGVSREPPCARAIGYHTTGNTRALSNLRPFRGCSQNGVFWNSHITEDETAMFHRPRNAGSALQSWH